MTVTSRLRQKPSVRIPKLGRLAYLLGLYAENFARIERSFGLSGLKPGRYLSSVGDALDLHIEVLEQHRYTTDLRITYALRDPETGEPDPSAYVRIYHDSRQAEVSHCYVGRRWQDSLGMRPSLSRLVGHRMRMNAFLNKWLEYLAEQGHSRFTLRLLEESVQPAG